LECAWPHRQRDFHAAYGHARAGFYAIVLHKIIHQAGWKQHNICSRRAGLDIVHDLAHHVGSYGDGHASLFRVSGGEIRHSVPHERRADDFQLGSPGRCSENSRQKRNDMSEAHIKLLAETVNDKVLYS
jgi:hypothetical protein